MPTCLAVYYTANVSINTYFNITVITV